MSKVTVESRGKVAILRLNNNITNAISPDLLDDFSKALCEVENKFEGMILAGGTKFFCIGLDLPELLKLDRTRMTDFFYKFNEIALNLFTLPLPTVCVISGHAIAGGNILALTCDYRFATSGKKLIGLNEIKLGVPVPYLADLMLRQIIGHRSADEMLYRGEFMTTFDAKHIGLIDEVFSEQELEGKAVERVSEMIALPRDAFAAIKTNRVETIREKYERNHKSKNEIFLNCWFSEPVQELLAEASQKF